MAKSLTKLSEVLCKQSEQARISGIAAWELSLPRRNCHIYRQRSTHTASWKSRPIFALGIPWLMMEKQR